MSSSPGLSRNRVIALVTIALGGMMLTACGPKTHRVKFHPISVMVLPPAPPKKIKISERIQFERGKARIRTRSHHVLDQVAATLKQRADIQLVEIQGHTDSKGKRAANLKLSLRRAQSVRQYLIRQGIEEARLACKGHGPNLPITTNTTRTGRRKNRRVEFIIVRQDLSITAHGG